MHLFKLLLLFFIFVITNRVQAKNPDSTQYLIFNNVENAQLKKFKNDQKLSILIDDNGIKEITGALTIINDTLISIGLNKCSINQIIAFKKNKKSNKVVGNTMMIVGATSATLGTIGLVRILNTSVDLGNFLYIIFAAIIATGAVIVGAFLGITGIGVRATADSKMLNTSLYTPQIKWIYN